MKSQTRTVAGVTYLAFDCAGCGSQHQIPVRRPDGDARVKWRWNEEFDTPTLEPSVKTTWGRDNPKTCHFILTSGVQNFCGDDTGAPNQQLPLPELFHVLD